MKVRHTLKFRLISICFFLIFLLSSILYVILYRDSRTTFLNEQTKSISHEMKTISDKLNLDISSLKKLLYYIANENSIKKLLSSEHPVGASSVAISKTLYDKLQLSSLYPYVNKLMLSSPETAIVTTGSLSGMPDDNNRLRALNYLDTLINDPSFGAAGIVDEPLYCFNTSIQSIPLVRSISNSPEKDTGLLYLSINPSLISEKIEGFSSLDSDFLYIKINDFYYQLTAGRFVYCETPPDIDQNYFIMGDTKKAAILLGNKSYTAVISTLSTEQWSLIQIINPGKVPFGILLPSYPLILCIMTFMFFILVLLIQFLISKPIFRISRQLEQIAGDISTPSVIERSSKEFFQISSEIEHMREKLSASFTEILLAEHNKKDLEFKVLQYQINPHFISNSLNTIKWMADIQNSYGISTMAVALSNLFRSVIRNDEIFITLRQELSTLNDFITIQRYRYKDIFTYEEIISDSSLYDSFIMKFTFQPIIENAIFHGIASSGKFGVIRLSAAREEADIIIRIYDNGVGMTDKQIQELFTLDNTENHYLNKIGIRNIDQRLKLEYGNDYGISIESVLGEYTLVTLKYPEQRRKQYV